LKREGCSQGGPLGATTTSSTSCTPTSTTCTPTRSHAPKPHAPPRRTLHQRGTTCHAARPTPIFTTTTTKSTPPPPPTDTATATATATTVSAATSTTAATWGSIPALAMVPGLQCRVEVWGAPGTPATTGCPCPYPCPDPCRTLHHHPTLGPTPVLKQAGQVVLGGGHADAPTAPCPHVPDVPDVPDVPSHVLAATVTPGCPAVVAPVPLPTVPLAPIGLGAVDLPMTRDAAREAHVVWGQAWAIPSSSATTATRRTTATTTGPTLPPPRGLLHNTAPSHRPSPVAAGVRPTTADATSVNARVLGVTVPCQGAARGSGQNNGSSTHRCTRPIGRGGAGA
jgi:hypothetical protein